MYRLRVRRWRWSVKEKGFKMRMGLGLAFAFALAAGTQTVKASAIVLNFSNLAGTSVTFSGGSFSFSSVGGGDPYQFAITSENGSSPTDTSAVGLLGYVNPG